MPRTRDSTNDLLIPSAKHWVYLPLLLYSASRRHTHTTWNLNSSYLLPLAKSQAPMTTTTTKSGLRFWNSAHITRKRPLKENSWKAYITNPAHSSSISFDRVNVSVKNKDEKEREQEKEE